MVVNQEMIGGGEGVSPDREALIGALSWAENTGRGRWGAEYATDVLSEHDRRLCAETARAIRDDIRARSEQLAAATYQARRGLDFLERDRLEGLVDGCDIAAEAATRHIGDDLK